MNDENQITTTFAKNDTPKLIKLAVLGIAAVVFIIALTMKLVPWGSQTAAGILLGLSALCMVGMLGLSAQDRIKERHKALGITGKDERVRQARQRAFAMVGKIAVVGMLAVAVILVCVGQIESTAFFLVTTGFFILALIGAALWLMYDGKIK